jgi:16S rRNA (cytosine1402-N4)-methyltransferase
MEGTYHVPVLCEVAIHALLRDPGWTYVDGTLGGGGHAEKICELLSPEGRCIGFDCDEDAVRVAAHRLERFGDRMTCVRANFREIRRELQLRGVRVIGGVLLDLGVSSFQIDEGSRGFSFRESGPLDMRMDRRGTLSALEIVNGYSESALADMFFRYGEERKARRVARFVVAERPIATTSDLRGAIEKAVGQQFLLKSLARVFQALRIAVNGELENLSQVLEEATSLLLPGGRLVVISYHSLEDRIVKQFFRTAAAQFAPSGHKLVPDARLTPRLRIVTPHPVEPTPKEIAQNPRARSARMRIAEKLKVSDSSTHA